MDLSKISTGKNIPNDINVIIEIPQGSNVKYEIDKNSGALKVDRILFTSMMYPTAYGFIPNTLALDNDPADVLVLSPSALLPGSIIRVRPIGMLEMEDGAGQDEKIICVPHDKVSTYYSNVNELEDLPNILLEQILYFFTHYKDLEPGKWVKISGWHNSVTAKQIILESCNRFKEKITNA